MSVATAIEAALHAHCGSAVDATYKGRMRSICANLRRDADWRAAVLGGGVAAADVGTMDSTQMLGAAARAAREAAARRAMKAALKVDGAMVERSTAFTCPACGANDVEVRTEGGGASARNDCTKNEIWGNKEEDNMGAGKATVQCQRCKFAWSKG